VKEKARNLRTNLTDAERRLWYHLRDRRLADYKIRRQHPIGPFIVDFICQEAWLIVELDGGQHASQIEEDRNRTVYLEARGFRVVRFWNNQVLSEIQSVLTVILGLLEADFPSPRPSP
jgi:very-short-patch-repair endonuclease